MGMREASLVPTLSQLLPFGSSYVDANPEQEEEDSKAHEERGHQGDEELFVDIPSVLGGGNLITGG